MNMDDLWVDMDDLWVDIDGHVVNKKSQCVVYGD